MGRALSQLSGRVDHTLSCTLTPDFYRSLTVSHGGFLVGLQVAKNEVQVPREESAWPCCWCQRYAKTARAPVIVER
jgi:hypothetical protein